MANDIQKIHQKVFELLVEEHEKDQSFLFTMRKINRKGRLDKGYWFLGDERYLTVSFWRGRDWVARIPRICFTITVDGLTYLELSQKDLNTHTDYFTKDLINTLGVKPRPYDSAFTKNYDTFANDYLKSLKSFLLNDKKIIDRAIAEDRAVSPFAFQYANGIENLYLSDFQRELQNIFRYQKLLREKEKRTGYLRFFKVEDFYPIKSLMIPRIPKDCKWIFITGENGAGKTSLLKAIATGLCQNTDNHRPMAELNSPFKITLALDSPTRDDYHTIKAENYSKNTKWLPKAFAAYGPVRLFTHGSLDSQIFNINEIKKRSRGATFGLFNSIDILEDLSMSLPLLDKPKYHQMAEDSFFENIDEILYKLFRMGQTGDGKFFHLPNDPTDEKPTNRIELNELPSGVRNFCSIIIDLLRRLRVQQSDIWDISSHNGIVLIDEIDLHLHPSMQKEIVVQLSETFPNIQFIVTTHSPIPLLGAPKNSMFINVINDEENGIIARVIDIQIENLLPNTILTSPIFNFSDIDSQAHEGDQRYEVEDNYEEMIFYKVLDRKIRERNLNSNKHPW